MAALASITALVSPSSVYSVDGVLHTSIHIEPTTHTIQPNSLTGGGLQLITRSLNGSIPGPALYLNPGDTLIIDFFNDLIPGEDEAYIHNELSAPNESNLHFHGLHVSGELPSDDTTLSVEPGQSFRYITTLPMDHLPGTHFVHPHRHGSTALQVGGGAAGAIIVQDTVEVKKQLPPQITEAPEILLVLQEMELEELEEITEEIGDSLTKATFLPMEEPSRAATSSPFSFMDDKIYLTNGQINPTVAIPPNQWIRLRIINAGWLFEGTMDLQLPGCEMQLIAKDGVYLPVLPRRIFQADLVNAGRADIMIQCSFDNLGPDGAHQLISDTEQPVLTIVADESSIATQQQSVAATPIPRTTIDFPEYLQDLRDTPASPGCSCATELDDLVFPEDTTTMDAYFHHTYQGAIVERLIESDEHPYHQHVHPFQIISGASPSDPESSDYYQVGDWHDTFMGNPTIRYKPTIFTGKVMIHCHILEHEDEGMMGIEYIHPANDTQHQYCTCGEFPPLLPLYAWILIGLAIVLIIVALVCWIVRVRCGRCMWIPLPHCCKGFCSPAAASNDNNPNKDGIDSTGNGGSDNDDEKDQEQAIDTVEPVVMIPQN